MTNLSVKNVHSPAVLKPIWSLVGLALSLIVPSTAVLQKYLGLAGVIAYSIIASLALFFLFKYRADLIRLAAKVTERQVIWLSVFTWIIILIAFLVVYPIANAGVVGGGSDHDEALNIAATELLHGHYPYYPKTYLGNPISPLPGALFLAMPFVLLGNSAFQNFFWLIIFFVAMKAYLKDSRSALLLLWTVLALSPIVLYGLLTGNDYLSNSLYVLLFILWMTTTASQADHTPWKMTLLAILLGIGLSSRANFVLLLPFVFSALVRNLGWKSAIRYLAITCITFLVITMPFYLYDPQKFSPLHTSNKLGQFQSIVPFAAVTIPLATGIVALILSFFQPGGRNLDALFRNCTIVLAFPVLCGVILSIIRAGRIDFTFALFGELFLYFGAVAFGSDLFARTENPM
jgi:hypothetical protein